MKRFLTPVVFLFVVKMSALHAAPPPLREQVLLNGEWPVGGAVPVYAGVKGFDEQTYAREVRVPEEWGGRVVKLEFGAVNFSADVHVNDTLVYAQVGGWMPFAVDITEHVKAGETFWLKVHVRGPKHPPITDERGGVAWPVGGWRNHGGIADDVWLRAYGAVHVEDAFIRTSVAKNEIAVDYTLRNATDETRKVNVLADARREGGKRVALRMKLEAITLAPNETRVVTVMKEWKKPELYWPDSPALYQLDSRVVADGVELDRETRRFGFREITLRGNRFYWNGVRINLYGDYHAFGDDWYLDSARWHSPHTWAETVDKLKAMNIRVLRWHHNPVPRYLHDVADEKGLLICSEAANYGRDFHKKSDHAKYLENARRTIEPWIRAERNHPSIYLWNATNEMTHSFVGFFPREGLVRLGEEIARIDPTRPVGYDGDTGRSNAALQKNPTKEDLLTNRIKDAALVDYHYPEGYNLEPAGSIYGWAHLVFPDRPTGAGELLHTKSPKPELQETMERNTWWLGVWLRGLRYTNWTNVKPACWWFTEDDLASDDPARRVRTLNLRNALAPIALFDKAYDDLGIAPFVTGVTPGGTLPTLESGTWERRALVLYNDEFSEPRVTVEVAIECEGRVLASERKTFRVELGEHVEFSCGFQVPHAKSGEMSLVLRTFKRGQMRFEEVRRFGVSTASATTRKVELSIGRR